MDRDGQGKDKKSGHEKCSTFLLFVGLSAIHKINNNKKLIITLSHVKILVWKYFGFSNYHEKSPCAAPKLLFCSD
tara:strand:+ start:7792 stop:8016 length:225 start_codon:yes stop_codon:yes gene_type:complete